MAKRAGREKSWEERQREWQIEPNAEKAWRARQEGMARQERKAQVWSTLRMLCSSSLLTDWLLLQFLPNPHADESCVPQSLIAG